MYEQILVPADGSPISNAGLAEATQLAKLTGARMRLLHAVDEMPLMAASWFGAMTVDAIGTLKSTGEAVLREARARLEREGVEVDSVLIDSVEGRSRERVSA